MRNLSSGITPFHVLAAISGNLALLFAPANAWGIDTVDSAGHTALHWAALRNPDPAVVTMLIALGVDVEARNSLGRTALQIAVAFNNVAVIAALLDNGADATTRDGLGREPMHTARIFGRGTAVINMLASKGGRLDAKDDSGRTPDYLAQQQQSLRDFIRFAIGVG